MEILAGSSTKIAKLLTQVQCDAVKSFKFFLSLLSCVYFSGVGTTERTVWE